ncbi:MAG: hypothetical protein EOM24_23490 [Chloroflexia bacterium]|nr:hypothetical protein [Chloroflexia bacterium]
MSDIGHAMFVAADSDDADCLSSYGSVEWSYDGSSSVSIESLMSAIVAAWDADAAHPLDCSGEELAAACNPARIVDSAGAWDDADVVVWLWDNVLEPAGVKAVITTDGAIVFDSALVAVVG